MTKDTFDATHRNATAGSSTAGSAAPKGVRLENLRKRGLDEILLHVRLPLAKAGIAAMALSSAVLGSALILNGFWLLQVVACASVLAATIATLGSRKTWTVRVGAGRLVITESRQLRSDRHAAAVPFEQIESIHVDNTLKGCDGSLVIATTNAPYVIGAGLSRDALQWLKDYLIMEVSGLTWRPAAIKVPGGRRQADSKHTNPLLLDANLALRLITLYLGAAPGAMKALTEAIKRKNVPQIRSHAHWLKSASANVGAHHLSEIFQLIETGDHQRQASEFAMLMGEAERKFPNVVRWLNDLSTSAEQRLLELGRSNPPIVNAASKCDRPGAETELIDARVLVVDDSALSRELARDTLSCLQDPPQFAEDGRQAVAAWRDGRFDIIFMDCEMIVMNGFEATRQIRSEEAARGTGRTAIIALTSHVLRDYKDKCLAAGMDDYLGKPYRPADLVDIIQKWRPNAVAKIAPHTKPRAVARRASNIKVGTH